MDVDDIEGKLARALSCMGTNDKEALVRQLQQVLGDQMSPESCAFFLDMNNWNVQAALGSYYDFGKSDGTGVPDECLSSNPPSMQFVKDVTIGEGESVPPNTMFVKAWKVRNNGSVDWPFSSYLKLIEGSCLAESDSKVLPRVTPGEEVEICVTMKSPPQAAVYQSRWQLFTPAGMPFGEPIWCILSVDETGLLGITQQLAGEHFEHSQQHPQSTYNPFIPAPVHAFMHDGPMESARLVPAGHLTLEDTDPPASPNGSSALCQAVSIQWQAMQTQLAGSSPVNIPTANRAVTPGVPPCTPSTPPAPPLTNIHNDDEMQ